MRMSYYILLVNLISFIFCLVYGYSANKTKGLLQALLGYMIGTMLFLLIASAFK